MLNKILSLLLLFTCIQNIVAQTDSLIHYFNHGVYNKAISISDELIAKQPANYNTYYYRGLSQKALYKYSDAVESFLKAKELSSNQTSFDLTLANTWEKAGNVIEAMVLYNSVLENDSLNIIANARLGSIYKSQKEYYIAANYYTQLIYIDTTNAYYYSQLAYCVSKIGLHEQAEGYYLTAYKLNTNDFTSVKGFLGELVKQKYYEQAEAYIDSFLYVFPENKFLLKQQAYLAAISSNYLDAVKGFKKVVELGDSSSFTCKYYGQSLYNNGNYEEAVFWLDRYLTKKPSDVKNQFVIALAYQKDYQYENSLDHFALVEDIIFDKEDIAQLHRERAQTYIDYGDYYSFRDSTGTKKKKYYDLALENFMKAEEFNPQKVKMYKEIGALYDRKLHNAPMALYYYQIYYNKLDVSKIDTWELQWIQDKLGKLKEEVHFMGE